MSVPYILYWCQCAPCTFASKKATTVVRLLLILFPSEGQLCSTIICDTYYVCGLHCGSISVFFNRLNWQNCNFSITFHLWARAAEHCARPGIAGYPLEHLTQVYLGEEWAPAEARKGDPWIDQTECQKSQNATISKLQRKPLSSTIFRGRTQC